MRFFVFSTFLLLSSLSFAGSYSDIPDTFFDKLNSKNPESAIEYLYETNEWASKNEEQVASLKAQVKNLNALVGKYLFHELISEKK